MGDGSVAENSTVEPSAQCAEQALGVPKKTHHSLPHYRFPVLFFLQDFFVERFGSDIRSVGTCDRSALDKSFSEKARLFERNEISILIVKKPLILQWKRT